MVDTDPCLQRPSFQAVGPHTFIVFRVGVFVCVHVFLVRAWCVCVHTCLVCACVRARALGACVCVYVFGVCMCACTGCVCVCLSVWRVRASYPSLQGDPDLGLVGDEAYGGAEHLVLAALDGVGLDADHLPADLLEGQDLVGHTQTLEASVGRDQPGPHLSGLCVDVYTSCIRSPAALRVKLKLHVCVCVCVSVYV